MGAKNCSDLHRLSEYLLHLNPLLLAAALLCSYLGWLINSFKWQRLLATYGISRSVRELFRLNLAALLYGIALPGQVTGEALKAIRLGTHTQSRQPVYMSVFLDRLTGLTGLAVLGAAALLLDARPASTWLVTTPCLAILVVVALAGSALLALLRLLAPSRLLVGRLAVPLARLVRGGGQTPAARDLALSLMLGIAFQVSVTATNWLVAVALGLDVSPLALAWIVAVASLIQVLPISIAGVGPREGAYVGLLALYAVPPEPALTMSLLIFGLLVALGLTGSAMDLLIGDTK
jgi:uncharacterized membrane protein YbhN (UPF0104 family)